MEEKEVTNSPENDHARISNVTASCKLCDWSAKGTLHLEESENVVKAAGMGLVWRGGISDQCLAHHDKTRRDTSRAGLQHNQFTLSHNGEERGWMSVSSAAVGGFFKYSKGAYKKST